jgi:aminopeptidase YwaD
VVTLIDYPSGLLPMVYPIPKPLSREIPSPRSAVVTRATGEFEPLRLLLRPRSEGQIVKLKLLVSSLMVVYVPGAFAHVPPLLPEKDVAAIANELSGETAKRNLEGLARFHRQRGSQGFHAAAELIAERARAYGLSNVEILKFPTDGKIFYGTQRSRLAWDASEGELSEVKDGVEVKIASYAAEPIVLAEDSESADVTTELIDVGDGTKESDYAGKDVKGKIVLVAEPAMEVQDIAVGKFNAAGIISYAQNQKTAWSGENDNLIRWGHLKSFSPNQTFAFMVSLQTARAMQERLKHGASVRLHAKVVAGQHAAAYEVVTATIEGSDPALSESEIAYSCHLDHQRPGANDNASGCVTILEAARALQKLIAEGKLARPARTLRFIWPPEVEGTVTLLNAKPELARRIKTVIHMDMVGGGLDTKAVFHVTRGPRSLPSFVQDVAWAFASWINEESYEFAASDSTDYPLIAPEGGKEPLRAEYSSYTMGSDHDVYQDSSFAIPAIYLNDWPDRYIHTNFDTAANIDPTKLKRAALIGAASGYFLAQLSLHDVVVTKRAVETGRLLRAVESMQRQTTARSAAGGASRVLATATTSSPASSTPAAAATSIVLSDDYEHAVLASVDAFVSASTSKRSNSAQKPRHDGTPIFRRRPEPRGPLMVFGYDYFTDHAESVGVPIPKLLSYDGEWGGAPEYAYEALNFADGSHSSRQITAELSAEYGPIPEALVIEYLQALKRIGIVE